MTEPLPTQAFRIPRSDVLHTAGVALVTALVTYVLSRHLLFTATNLDVWFDSDSIFVLDQMVNRYSTQQGTNSRHPIYSLLTYPIVFVFAKTLGFEHRAVAFALTMVMSTMCGTAMYVALRLMKRTVLVSWIFTGVFIASSAGMLYLGIIERLIPGALSVLLCLIAFLLYERRLLSLPWLIVFAAGTLGITITNFVVGGVALLVAVGFRRAIGAAAAAVALIAVLNAAGTWLFPGQTMLADIGHWPVESSVLTNDIERKSKGGTTANKIQAFAFHSWVLPAPSTQNKAAPNTAKRFLSVQKISVLDNRAVGLVAVGLWLILLCVGTVNSIRTTLREPIDVVLGVCIVAQFSLFLVFGTETILYAAYYVPLLTLFASKCTIGPRLARPMTALALLFLCALVWNNAESFFAALETVKLLYSN